MVVEIEAYCFTSAAVPLKDKPPLLVDADRVEALKIAAELFEVVASFGFADLFRSRRAFGYSQQDHANKLKDTFAL